MRTLTVTMLAVASACAAEPRTEENPSGHTGDPAPAVRAACPDGRAALPVTGLCQGQAAALLGKAVMTTATPGCIWAVRETPFGTDMLLYRAWRCGTAETSVELRVGNHMSQLVYTRRADGGSSTDADGASLVLARIFAGHPGGRARALRETRETIGDPRAAARCRIRRPYQSDGLPADALIVDVARVPGEAERDDAAPACGPFGYMPAGGSIDFWRPHQGYAWFFQMGTDVWDIDPASLTLVRRDRTGRWMPVATPA